MKKAKGFIRAIQEFMDSARGKTVLNYLYSWGAAIVILGTLFKLTHLAGANIMLFVGMGTEVLVFFFSAFERPYEVAEEEKREEAAEEALAMGGTYNGLPIIINGPVVTGTAAPVSETGATPAMESNIPMPAATQVTESNISAPATSAPAVATAMPSTPAPVVIGGGAVSAGIPVANVGEMDKATEEYVEQVRALNEALQRIAEQTEALGRNMQEMDTLSRNLTGVNAIYEIQLRSAGGQLDAIDKVNEQTKIMAGQVEELNKLYARMIEAMTTNMNRPQL